MKKRAFVCVPLVALALLLVGCGGGAPTGIANPDPAPPPTPSSGSIRFSIASGDELIGLPVQPINGTVTIGSVTKPFTGEVVFDGVRLGDSVRIDAGPAFVVRTTLVRSMGEQRVYLRPNRPGFDETFGNQISYGAGRIMVRPASNVTVVLAPELQETETIHAHEQAIAEINEALGGVIHLSLSLNPVSQGIVCNTRLNPALSSNYGAIYTFSQKDTVITGAEIQYRALQGARHPRLVLHELFHVTGMHHVDVAVSIMRPTWPLEPTIADTLAIRLHYQRPSGNMLPDDDTIVKGASVREKRTFSCGW